MLRRSRGEIPWARRLSLAALIAGTFAPGVALAEVRREGDWSDDPEVSLDLESVPRAEAVKRLAAEAGWSVVLNAPRGDLVSLHVEDQRASKLLEILLADGRYAARREGTLISVSPLAPGDKSAPPPVPGVPPVPAIPAVPPLPAIPPVPPLPPQPASADGEGRDRSVTGGNLRVEAGEVVHDVTVMGGNLDVYGTVTGDVSVMGGNVHVHRGARVKGDAATVGGNLIVEAGAAVDGDVGVVGGVLTREDGARVGGEIHEGMRRHHRKVRAERTEAAAARAKSADAPKAATFLHDAVDAVNRSALLFVFGAVLLALAPERMERLKLQIASRPMRTFATGVVAVVPVLLVAVVLCIPVITIPFVLAALVGGLLAGICSVLETVGGALLAHRTKNPYVHLACGGLVFLVAGALPIVGGLIKLAVLFTAVGSAVATRGAGLLPVRGRGASPYRTADAR